MAAAPAVASLVACDGLVGLCTGTPLAPLDEGNWKHATVCPVQGECAGLSADSGVCLKTDSYRFQ